VRILCTYADNVLHQDNSFLFNNRNRKLEISIAAPIKADTREPAYLQALYQNKIDRQRAKIQIVRQADSQTDFVDGVWS